MEHIRYTIMVVCAGFLLIGWTGSWETIKKESEKITSISARFTQTKQMKILAKPLVSHGFFYFKAPASVRWAYDEPVKSVLLMGPDGCRRFIRGQKGWSEDAGIGTAPMGLMLQEIALWSRGRFTESRGFTAELAGGSEPKIMLKPRDEELAKIILDIEIIPAPDRPGEIRSIIINEGGGNTTRFDFVGVQLYAPLDETLFKNP